MRNNPCLEAARAERGALVAAALVVLRAWHGAQRSASNLEPLGSFEEWSFRIREPLLWLDRIDPCESIATVRDSEVASDDEPWPPDEAACRRHG